MPLLIKTYAELANQAVTIASGGSLSGAVALPPGEYPAAIMMPATWTTANLTFQGSVDGTTFYDMYESDGTELTVTADASQYIVLSPDSFWGVHFLKVRSGTTGTPVNQAAARSVTVVTRGL